MSRRTREIKIARLRESLKSWAEQETEKLIQEAEKRGEREARVEILKASLSDPKAMKMNNDDPELIREPLRLTVFCCLRPIQALSETLDAVRIAMGERR